MIVAPISQGLVQHQVLQAHAVGCEQKEKRQIFAGLLPANFCLCQIILDNGIHVCVPPCVEFEDILAGDFDIYGHSWRSFLGKNHI